MHRRMMAVLAGIMLLAFAGGLHADEDGLAVEAIYRFEEGEGQFVLDDGPNGYHGIANKGLFEREGVWVEGKEGKAIHMDAEEERHLVLPRAVLGAEPQEGMIEFWLKPAKDQRGTIFSKYTTGWGGFYIRYEEGGGIQFWRQGARDSSIATTPGGHVPVDKWTHIRVRWDPEEGSSIYINEDLQASSGPVVWTGGRLITTVGCSQPINRDPRSFFTGAIDELKIYVRPLEEE